MIKNDWLHSINCFSIKNHYWERNQNNMRQSKKQNYFTGNKFIDDNDHGIFKYI